MRRPAPPIVATSDAMIRIKRAANAAGMTPEELGDLLVDSGITALPPSDGITRRYTMEDAGLRLWSEMQGVRPSRRAEWFASLTPVGQTAVIVTLRDRGFSTHAIACDFKLDPMQVNRTFNKHADDLGAQVVGLRLSTIAGQMQLVAEKAIEMESEKGNGRAMWSIEKDRVAVLQSLGIVDTAVHRSEVTHKLDDAQKAEIQSLVELEQKKLTRREEIKQIEAEVFDAPPEELDEAPD